MSAIFAGLFSLLAVPAEAWFPHGVAAISSAVPWTVLELGGGGNVTGIDYLGPNRFARGDVFGGYIFGADNQYHNVVTSSNWLSGGLWTGFSGVMELVGAPGDATKALMYGGGNVYYSGNVSASSPNAITWCLTGGWTKTAETANNVIGASDPGQFAAVDPYNSDHAVIGTPATGIFETFNLSSAWSSGACNGTAATWAAISTGSIPLSVRSGSGGAYPGYAIAFDPTGGTHSCNGGGSTCAAKAYIFSSDSSNSGSNAGVYATSDGGGTWTLTMSGPTTARHIKVSAASAGGGDVFVTTNDGNRQLWELIGSTWTHLTAVDAHAGDVAINPNNGDQIAVVEGGAMRVSLNGSANPPTFSTSYTGSLAGGDAPWQATIGVNIAAGGTAGGVLTAGATFDGSGNLIVGEGQGLFTTPLPSGAFTLTAQVKGIQGLANHQMIVPSQGTIFLGAQDEMGCSYSIATASTAPSFCGPQSQFYNSSGALSYASGLSIAPGTSFAVAKISPNAGSTPDLSGYSTNGFAGSWSYRTTNYNPADYLPFNRWYSIVPGSALSNDGGLVKIDLAAATSGAANASALATFAAGDTLSAKSLVCVMAPGTFNQASGLANPLCYPVSKLDSTHIDLTGSTYSALYNAKNYIIWVPAESLSPIWGHMTVNNVTASASPPLVHVTVSQGSYLANGAPVCFGTSGFTGSSVTMTGATVVNGCWIIKSISGKTFDLIGSSFVGGDTYVSGGVGLTWPATSGSIAAASATNWTSIGANNDLPLCTTDAGANWTPVRMSDDSDLGVTTTTAATAAAGATSISTNANLSTSSNYNLVLASGRVMYFGVASTSGSGPYTINFTSPQSIPVGDSVASGAKLYLDANGGWINAFFIDAHVLDVDQVTANTFYAFNVNAGLMKWTNCGTPVRTAHADGVWNAQYGFNDILKTVPGEAGHLFFTTGAQSGSQPVGTHLQRMCNGSNSTDNSASFQAVTGMFEVSTFGFGKSAPGKSYPSEYVVGFYASDGVQAHAVYGIWESTDDPNHGATGTCNLTQTWTNIGTAAQNAKGGYPLGWFAPAQDISGDPSVYGQVYYAGPFGAFYGVFP